MADDFDLDFEDDDLGLDDYLDFDMDPLVNRPPPKNSREAVSNMLKDASSSFVDDVAMDPLETAGEIAKAAIPKSLSKESAIMFELKDKLKDEISAATDEVKSQSRGTIKALQKILPKNEKISNIVDKLMNFIGEDETAGPAGPAGPTAEEIQNDNITGYITDLMGEKSDRETMEEVIKHQIEANRFKTSTELTANIATNTENIRKFNNEIANNYFRRSLELQYKSLFTAREQLAVIKTGMDTFKNQFEAIIHNTALPDITKVRSSEVLGSTIKGRMHNKLADKFYSEDNLVGRMRSNLTNKVTQTKDNILGGMSGIRDAGDQKDMMSDMAGMGGGPGGLLGSLVSGFAKTKLGEHLSKKIEGNEQAQEGIHSVKNAFMDPKAFFKSKQDRQYNEDGSEKLASSIKNGLFSFMEDMTGDNQKKNAITIEKTNLAEAAQFDGRAYSSITKVIPGLLSKIYGEVKTIRTGGDKPEDNEISYSHNDDTFKSAKELMADVKSGIKSDVSKDSIYYIDKVIDLIAANGNLKVDEAAHKDLRKGFMSYVMDGGTLAPGNMIGEGLIDHFSDKVGKSLETSVTATLVKSKKDTSILDELNYSLKNLKDSIPNMAAKTDELNNSGNLNILEDMGLVTRDKITKQASFDNEAYKKFVLDEIEKTETGDIQHLLDAKAEEVDKLKEEESKSKATHKDAIDKLKGLRDKTVTKFKKTASDGSNAVNDSDVFNNIKDNVGTVKESVPDSINGIKDKMNIPNIGFADKVAKLKLLTKEAEETMRDQFFNSNEYKSGSVKTFEEYTTALGYKLNKDSMKAKIKDVLAKTRSLDKMLFKAGTGFVKTALGFGGKAKDKLKVLAEDQEAALRTKFFASMEYKNGTVKTFEEYVNSHGFTVDKSKSKMKGLLKSVIGKSKLSGIKSAISKKLPGKGSIPRFLKKTHKMDRDIIKATPGVVGKAVWGGAKLGAKAGLIIPKLLVDKLLAKLSNDKKPKKAFNDADGDGDRDGNWKDRLAGKKKGALGKTKGLIGGIAGKAKSMFGGVGKMLLMAVPAILGLLGKVPKLLGFMVKGIKFIPKMFGILGKLPGLLMKLPMLLGGVMGKAVGVAKTAATAGAVALAGGKKLLTGKGGTKVAEKVATKVATKAATGGATALAAGAALKGKAPEPGMIKSVMNKLTGPITKKLGKKAGAKVGVTLAAKIAARAVPFAGAALLAYDGVMIAKDMLSNGTGFKSAVSKQILGFDLFSNDSVAKDEDGNPIKPDEEAKEEKPLVGKTKVVTPPVVKPLVSPANNIGYKSVEKTTSRLAGKPLTIGALTANVQGDGVSEDSTSTIKGPEASTSSNVGDIHSRGGPYADPAGGLDNVYKNGKNVDFSGFHPKFAEHLSSMANEYNEITGDKIPINSGYRSYESQLALKRKYPGKAATPGKSPHEFGLAFDTNTSVAESLDKLGLMKKYGFTRPVGKETWHVEAIGNSLDMNSAKKDPTIAEAGLLASLGKGGGGWGAGSKGSNNNRGRNTKHQQGIMGATGKPVDDKETAISTLSPANNVGFGKSKMGSSKIPTGGAKTMRQALADSAPTENLPGAGVDNAPKPAAQVIAPKPKPVSKITTIEETTNNLNKVKNSSLVKPMHNNMDLARQANSLLGNIGNSLEQSLYVQRKMLETLERIENASPVQVDASGKPKQVASNSGMTIGDYDARKNKSQLPEPTVSLKRKSDISA